MSVLFVSCSDTCLYPSWITDWKSGKPRVWSSWCPAFFHEVRIIIFVLANQRSNEPISGEVESIGAEVSSKLKFLPINNDFLPSTNDPVIFFFSETIQLCMFSFIIPVYCQRSSAHLPVMGLFRDALADSHRRVRAALPERPSGQYGGVDLVDYRSASGHSHVLPRLLRHGTRSRDLVCLKLSSSLFAFSAMLYGMCASSHDLKYHFPFLILIAFHFFHALILFLLVVSSMLIGFGFSIFNSSFHFLFQSFTNKFCLVSCPTEVDMCRTDFWQIIFSNHLFNVLTLFS